ncbi:MAG: hypothetical protein KNU04_gp13 [crAssphage sp. isolate ctbg_1]|uniref:Uncharacterized protein n=1 Tax=crAssphage sp. isolate ctbg_1 TaxID=2989854 RepID=A0A345MSY8_9CAUD|nr:MAG: hypothetical protein KNU04_gp13 [crAssphage sp. isolate ctbg_1]AXH74488.1 MAG: hypothetical protein [crAssphage sp. isolate ctbg_1]
MIKLRLIILMIVVLFSYSLSWSKENDELVLFTGQRIETDTTVAIVPIDIIRQANIKLTERLVYKDIIDIQNIQIQMYKTTDSLSRSRIVDLTNTNTKLLNENVDIKKDNNKYKIISGIEATIIIGLLIGLIIN